MVAWFEQQKRYDYKKILLPYKRVFGCAENAVYFKQKAKSFAAATLQQPSRPLALALQTSESRACVLVSNEGNCDTQDLTAGASNVERGGEWERIVEEAKVGGMTGFDSRNAGRSRKKCLVIDVLCLMTAGIACPIQNASPLTMASNHDQNK